MAQIQHMRVARASDNLDALLPFYRDGLGFDLLFQFKNHSGFDGIILGRKGMPYHLEFTYAHGHNVERAPTKDNLLVFYLPEADDWQTAVARMRKAGHEPVPSFNPFWDQHGLTFEDPDGYRVVFQHASWNES